MMAHPAPPALKSIARQRRLALDSTLPDLAMWMDASSELLEKGRPSREGAWRHVPALHVERCRLSFLLARGFLPTKWSNIASLLSLPAARGLLLVFSLFSFFIQIQKLKCLANRDSKLRSVFRNGLVVLKSSKTRSHVDMFRQFFFTVRSV